MVRFFVLHAGKIKKRNAHIGSSNKRSAALELACICYGAIAVNLLDRMSHVAVSPSYEYRYSKGRKPKLHYPSNVLKTEQRTRFRPTIELRSAARSFDK